MSIHEPRDLAYHYRRLRGGHALGHRRVGHLERGELIYQPFDALWARALVHSIQARHPALGEQSCDGFVGGDHQVLDQAVGLGRLLAGADAYVALGVELNSGSAESSVTALRCARACSSAAAAVRAAASASPQGSLADWDLVKMRSTCS